MRSYMFLMDFLEAVTKETSSLLKSQQSLMRALLEAAKVSETKLTDFFSTNIEKVSILHTKFTSTICTATVAVTILYSLFGALNIWCTTLY